MEREPTIHVTLIDVDTGKPLGDVKLPASRLPASFDAQTTLHLGDDDWTVISAEPSDGDAWRAKGALSITVQYRPKPAAPTESLSPHKVLFGVPTLADPLPPAGEPRPEAGTAQVVEMHEDGWRQIELISSTLRNRVAEEMAAIESVVAQREGVGYRTVHMRRGIDAGVKDPTLTLDALRALFRAPLREYAGFALRETDTLARDGFAFRTPGGLLVYGLAPGGVVTVLGVQPDRNRRGPSGDTEALKALRRSYGLLMVDWCARTVIDPPPAATAN